MADEIRALSLERLHHYARGRLGLILGPAVSTANDGFFSGLSKRLADLASIEPKGAYHETGENAVASGIAHSTLLGSIEAFTTEQRPHPALSQLARAPWTAVLSCSLDHFFETKLQKEFEARPLRRDVSIISGPTEIARPSTIPVYKLLGSAQRRDAVATTADFLRRSAAWHEIAREFVDAVKASPTLCVGLADAPWFVDQLLGHLFSVRSTHPARLVFLANDPILAHPRLLQLIPPSRLVVADTSSVMDAVDAIEPSLSTQQATVSFARIGQDVQSVDLSGFSDVASVLNAHLEPSITLDERPRLLDYLFMPDATCWDPFAHNLDFRRSAAASVLAKISKDDAAAPADYRLIVLHGRAASGKTTLLKRVAYDVAKGGSLAVWLRPYWYPDAQDRLEQLFRAVKHAVGDGALTLFMDDPRRLGDLSLSAVLAVARRVGLRLVIVAGMRTSDYHTQFERPGRDVYVSLGIDGEAVADDSIIEVVELGDNLDDDEWSRLSAYLCTLGVAADQDDAARQVSQATHRSTRDTLALLYFLVPDTQPAIRGSVQDEYIRLGNSSGLANVVIGDIEHSSQILQDAYGMVAVAGRYNAPLPVEVLVAALGIDYSTWLDASHPEGPVWGLLYPDDSVDDEGAKYRVRNVLVQDIIVKHLNGGAFSSDGEFVILRKLLGACSGTHPIYYEFVTRVLTPHKALDHLSLHEGLALYAAAERALPCPDRLVLHHKGLFIRAKGGDLNEAIQSMRDALEASGPTRGGKEEPSEFIHTSIAAAIIDKVKTGTATLDHVKGEALAELEKSRSPGFLNPNGVHVYARLVHRLAIEHKDEASADRIVLINRALAELDHYLIQARTQRGGRLASPANVAMLEEQRDRITADSLPPDRAQEVATQLWTTNRSAHGFVLAARLLLDRALAKKNAGSEFREAMRYMEQARSLMLREGVESPELGEVALLAYYEWQVRKRSRRPAGKVSGAVNWETLRVAAQSALSSPRHADNPFYRYLLGLALCHLGDWPGGRRLFDLNRRAKMPGEALHAARDYLLDPEGARWRLQGQIRTGPGRRFLYVADLRQDFVVDTSDRWGRGDAVRHGYVVFAFAGPKAVPSEHLLYEDE